MVGIVSSNNILKRLYVDKYLLLNRKKSFLVAIVWVVSFLVHFLITNYTNINEIFFFFLGAFVIPTYFFIALVYTYFRHKSLVKR